MGTGTFRHEAFFYAGQDEFLAGVVPFVQGAVAAGEPTLVAVDEVKIRAIKASLNGGTEEVQFVDMREVGGNPARIIPAWRDFVAARGSADRPIRGVGEPIWAGRSTPELVECHQHESLLNVAFAATPAFRLLCPYDSSQLSDDVLEEAHRTHPLVADGDSGRESVAYVSPDRGAGPFAGVLPPPAVEPEGMSFNRTTLHDVRDFVSERAAAAGLAPSRTADIVLAVSELATNSVLHAGGEGSLLTWRENGSLLFEVHDAGELHDPLMGRERPTADRSSGRGLWLVNHLCDLVQMRSFPDGNVIRLHMDLHRD